MTMMFFVAFVASLWMVIAQPLIPIQHRALMDVYTGLGSFLFDHTTQASCVKLLFFSTFVSGCFSAGCNDTICPRFAMSSDCIGPTIWVDCSGGNVIRLSVFFFCPIGWHLIDLHTAQTNQQKTIEWDDFLVDWVVDGTYKFVRALVCCGIHVSPPKTIPLCQKLARQSIEWADNNLHWSIGGAQWLVRGRTS